MAKSFKHNGEDIIFNPATMVAEKVTDVETGEVTAYIVTEKYEDQFEIIHQNIYKINETIYNALTSK